MTRVAVFGIGAPALLVATGLAAAAQPPLNDTGETACSNGKKMGTCRSSGSYAKQDATQGRDAVGKTLVKIGAGPAGFDFTKLDSGGNILASAATSWSCVRDNVTSLVWEVKTDDGGVRDKDWSYSWYNSDKNSNGGNVGTANGGICGSALSACNTAVYVQAVNSQRLCGFNDWRLPEMEELYSIVDYSVPYPGPTVPASYFPNTNAWAYWTAASYAGGADGAWYIDFAYGYGSSYYKSYPAQIRLVRGGR